MTKKGSIYAGASPGLGESVDTYRKLQKNPAFNSLVKYVAHIDVPGFRWLLSFPIFIKRSNLELLIDVFEATYPREIAKEKSRFLTNIFRFLVVLLLLVSMIVGGVILFFNLKNGDSIKRSTEDNSLKQGNDEAIVNEFREILFLDKGIKKARDVAIDDLKRLGLIDGEILNFEVDDFKKMYLSVTSNNINKNDIKNAISQIYAYELAILEYKPSAIDNFYSGIKCKYENRYFINKEDFIFSLGFENIEDYEATALTYIESKKGEIGIGGESANYSNDFAYSREFSCKYDTNESNEGIKSEKTLHRVRKL